MPVTDEPFTLYLPPQLVAMYGIEAVTEAVRQLEASMFPLSHRSIHLTEYDMHPPVDRAARAAHWRAVIVKEMNL